MRGITAWNYSPYAPLTAPKDQTRLFICQLQPFACGFTLAFRGEGGGPWTVEYRKRGEERWQGIGSDEKRLTIRNLDDLTDYETRVIDSRGASPTRLVRTGDIPGVVINYLHPDDEIYAFSGRYLCSPSLERLADGTLLAAMDVYAPMQAQNLSLLFRSRDDGKTWDYVTEIYPAFWPKLFSHKGKLYLLAMACEYGDLLLGESRDGGDTWSPPVRLINGSNAKEMGPHKAPMPVIRHQGRLYTAIEYGSWKYVRHDAVLLSIDENDDLMNAANWHLTEPLPFDATWKGMPEGTLRGMIEGNAVVGRDGHVYDLLRLEQHKATPDRGNAVLLKMTGAPDDQLTFAQVIDFPLGASSKFVVLKAGDKYVAVGNECREEGIPRARNILSAAVSNDLIHWTIARRIVDASAADPTLNAFQYPDALLAGDDLLVLSRTAWNGAHSFHDSNCITFHRIDGFLKQYT